MAHFSLGIQTHDLSRDIPVSMKQMERSNHILDLVKRVKVIDDPAKILTSIRESEKAQGYKELIDRKSLLRLLVWLSEQGHIKNIFVKISLAATVKTLHFICLPEVEESDSLIQSVIEQVKMKSSAVSGKNDESATASKPKTKSNKSVASESKPDSISDDDDLNSVNASVKEMQQSLSVASLKGETLNQDRRAARKYGIMPKFVKMRELHCFLYYLTRDFTGDKAKANDCKDQLLNKLGSLRDADMERELHERDLFQCSIGQHMFVPPLPSHANWPRGWVLMCDLLLRMPLSLFVKVVHVTLEVPGLDSYLNHPIRKHYLIRMLPETIRNRLLYKRKYIFSVNEVACNLAHMGLVQFGPQLMKEKDQVFVYVNSKAGLVDTRLCQVSYNKVVPPPDLKLPKTVHTFTAMEEVEKFWIQIFTVAMDTPLGKHGSDEEASAVEKRKCPQLMACLAPQTPETAVSRDVGNLPGDGEGVAGLDSSLFVHIKRNWQWVNRPRVPTQTDTNTPKVKGVKRKQSTDDSEAASKKAKAAVKKKRERRPYYDEVDQEALKLMRKLRVDWTPQEDSLLLVCKVAGWYLCDDTRTKMVRKSSSVASLSPT